MEAGRRAVGHEGDIDGAGTGEVLPSTAHPEVTEVPVEALVRKLEKGPDPGFDGSAD